MREINKNNDTICTQEGIPFIQQVFNNDNVNDSEMKSGSTGFNFTSIFP